MDLHLKTREGHLEVEPTQAETAAAQNHRPNCEADDRPGFPHLFETGRPLVSCRWTSDQEGAIQARARHGKVTKFGPMIGMNFVTFS